MAWMSPKRLGSGSCSYASYTDSAMGRNCGWAVTITSKSFLEYRLPPSAFGDYEQAQYGVLDHEGAPVDIILDWDDQDRLRITVHQHATDEELRTLFFIGTHPQA